MTERTDDYIKNMIRRMLVAEGWTKPAAEDQIKQMVDRFLAWRLPVGFNPDNGISFEPIAGKDGPHPFCREPSGTNLLDAAQAEAMVRHMLATPQ